MDIEKELLDKIKFVLLSNNEAQAIRLIEQYWFDREEKTKAEKLTIKPSCKQLPSWEEMLLRRDEYKDTITTENETTERGCVDLGFKYCYLWLRKKLT